MKRGMLIQAAVSATLLILGSLALLGCGNQGSPSIPAPAPQPESTPTPTPALETEPTPPQPAPSLYFQVEPLPKGVIIGDVSMALSKVERGSKETKLCFAFRRVNSAGEYGGLLLYAGEGWYINVFDDHGNRYRANNCQGDPVPTVLKGFYSWGEGRVSWAPLGFTWITEYGIPMPQVAPVERIEFWKNAWEDELLFEQDFSIWEPFTPDLGRTFESGLISEGDTLKKGDYLLLTIGEIKAEGDTWVLPLKVENQDYNARKFEQYLGLQMADGAITWDEGLWDKGGVCYTSGIEDYISAQTTVWFEFQFPGAAIAKPRGILIFHEGIKLLEVTNE
jgi:hypothetical protein